MQRWLKFAKYLPEYGWEPVIFTPENPDFDQKDESLLKEVPKEVEVLHFPIWEPYQIFKRLSGKKQLKQGQVLEEGKKGLLSQLAIFIRGNLFIPDPRKFWVKPSVEYLSSILRSNDIGTVITTGPPHSMHLIGMKLKMKNPGLSWVADFRDPWSQWDILKQFRMLPFAWARHRKLAQQVFKVADRVLTVSDTWAADLKKLGARRVSVITNGYDHQQLPEATPVSQDRFVLSHAGMLNDLRNPTALWGALEKALAEHTDFQKVFTLRLTGILSDHVLSAIRSFPLLSDRLELQDSVPHDQVYQVYAESTVLLLILNDSLNAAGHLPGKLFEYLSAGRSILALGLEDGDAGKILAQTGTGSIFNWQNQEGIYNYLMVLYDQWRAQELTAETTATHTYTRQHGTSLLARLLHEL